MKKQLLRLSVLSMLCMLFGGGIFAALTKLTSNRAPAEFKDFAVQLTKDGIFNTSTNQFGVKVADDGTYTATTFDDETANFTVSSARWNDGQHGWVNCVFTIPVQGPVLIKLGDCRFGAQTGTIKDAENNVTELTKPAKACWDPNAPDQNVVATYYRGLNPTTLTVTYEGYCPFISVTAVDPADLPAEVSKHSIAFAAGEGTGIAPDAIEENVGTEISLPTNYSLYVEGKTLTGWSDGTNTYAPGAKFTVPENDVNLTAVFTANEVSLADRIEPVTLKWNLEPQTGVTAIAIGEGKTGFRVAQATIGEKSIDVKMDVDNTYDDGKGKLSNQGRSSWCQANKNTKITIPSCKGATIAMKGYQAFSSTTIDGQSDYTSSTDLSYEVASSNESVDIIISNDCRYLSFIQVTLPVVQQQGGETFDNVAVNVVWPMNNESEPTAYTPSLDGVFSAIVLDYESATIPPTADKYSATANITNENAEKTGVIALKFQPKTGGSDVLKWFVKPASGLTFTPMKLTGYVNRIGTDVENGITISAYTEGNTPTTLGTWTALRNGKTNSTVGDNKTSKEYDATAIYKFEITLTAEQQSALTSAEGFYLTSTIGVASNKQGAFGNVSIEGLINGTKADVASYTLAAVASPEAGGTVSKYPNADEYEDGTEVTLTATENFGYDFVNWTNAAGDEVSTDAKFKYTVSANETLTANFKKVETYALDLTVDGTNDYMVTVDPAPTVVEGKWMYEAGTTVVLTANQYEKLVTFTNWSDNTTNSELSVTMDEDKQITAFFTEGDIIAGWDFYKAGNNGRKADFAATDNDADALNLVETETGNTSGWLDKSTLAGGGYESFKGAAVNWRSTVGTHHWQTKVNAEAFTDINVQFQMLYNYNAYQTYNVEYSLDGETWNNCGSITMTGPKAAASFNETLPAACNNQKDLYIRMIADLDSKKDGAAGNDGNTLAMFFITGTPKLVDDPVPPTLLSSVPENNATGASASGKIVLNFDKKVQVVEGTEANLVLTGALGGQQLTPAVSGKVITFAYKGLDYAKSYTFTLPASSVQNLTGATQEEAISIQFTTMERPTVTKGLYDAVVSNVDELMAAINAAEARADKNQRFRIFIKNGEYTIPLSSKTKSVNGYEVPECITFINSGNISFIGESRDGVVITNGIDPKNTFEGQYGTTSKYDGIGNCDVFQTSGSGNYWQDLTVETGMDDATGRDLAIHDKGTKTIYKNVGLRGFQDTWTSNNNNGLYYFEDGYLRGRTDYMCGKGDAYFNGVELRQIAGGYAAVPSTPANIGWVYKDCVINGEGAVVKVVGGSPKQTVTAEDANGNYTLGRPWGKGTPVAVFIDTKMNVVPSAIGWSEMSGGFPKRFAEWNSTTSTGSVIDLSGRKTAYDAYDEYNKETDTYKNRRTETCNPILSEAEAADYADMSKMFGDWQPKLATEQAPVVTEVVFNNTTLSWVGNDYSLLYAVCKDGKVVGFTTEETYTIDDATAKWSVRSANEMGGLSEPSADATYTTGIHAVKAAIERDEKVIYNLAGQRVDAAYKGLVIRDGVKIMQK